MDVRDEQSGRQGKLCNKELQNSHLQNMTVRSLLNSKVMFLKITMQSKKTQNTALFLSQGNNFNVSLATFIQSLVT
jgi:hypothetical protein